MILFGLLIVPMLIGLAGLLLSKGKRVTLKEFLVQEAIVAVLIVIGYFIALSGQTADTEIWNGTIAKKWQGTQGCCHSYPCNPHPCNPHPCGSKNSSTCYDTCYDTCYEHSHDINWNAETSNGETAYYEGCNRPSSAAPQRYGAIVVGEPTAIEHSYTNYIKGSPDTILRRQGIAERFAGKIPEYPKVFDHYRVNRVIGAGVAVPDAKRLNARLSDINARLGAPKQVNVILILTKEGDQMYLEAVREAWIGGKKNDLVVLVGVPEYPRIAWAGVISWTRNEEIKISIRDRLVELSSFQGDKALDIIAEEVGKKFVRRPMADFEYLSSTIKPPMWAQWLLFVIGIIISVGLAITFWIKDPFGDEHR